jgi:hypothetical protein
MANRGNERKKVDKKWVSMDSMDSMDFNKMFSSAMSIIGQPSAVAAQMSNDS